MKANYKILMYSFLAFFVGIFIGFVIIDQNLAAKWLQVELLSWDALGGLGSIFAACVALYIGHRGWKEAEKARQEDRRQKEFDSALIAYTYFRRLGRVATLLASENNVYFKNGSGQAKQRIEEIYDGWKHANNSDDCVRSIIFADNWTDDKWSLIDTFEVILQTARSEIHLQEEKEILKARKNIKLEALSYALDVFATLSHLHSRNIKDLVNSDLSIEIKNRAEQSVDKLKGLQREVKEASKG